MIDVLCTTDDVKFTELNVVEEVVTVDIVSDELITEDNNKSENDDEAEMNIDDDIDSGELDIEAIEGRNAGQNVRG